MPPSPWSLPTWFLGFPLRFDDMRRAVTRVTQTCRLAEPPAAELGERPHEDTSKHTSLRMIVFLSRNCLLKWKTFSGGLASGHPCNPFGSGLEPDNWNKKNLDLGASPALVLPPPSHPQQGLSKDCVRGARATGGTSWHAAA